MYPPYQRSTAFALTLRATQRSAGQRQWLLRSLILLTRPMLTGIVQPTRSPILEDLTTSPQRMNSAGATLYAATKQGGVSWTMLSGGLSSYPSGSPGPRMSARKVGVGPVSPLSLTSNCKASIPGDMGFWLWAFQGVRNLNAMHA